MSIVTLNDRAVRSVTAFGSLNTGSMVFIKKLTASSSATLSFVNGSSDVVLDSTYKEYVFTFKNIHPATDDESLRVNFSSDSGSNYGMTKTSTFFRAYHNEGGSDTNLQYLTSKDLAQSTNPQEIAQGIGNDNDQTACGYFHIFNPSSTTFVKNFMSRFNIYEGSNYSIDQHCAGYVNSTSAINAIRFDGLRGNFAGDICLYGIL